MLISNLKSFLAVWVSPVVHAVYTVNRDALIVTIRPGGEGPAHLSHCQFHALLMIAAACTLLVENITST